MSWKSLIKSLGVEPRDDEIARGLVDANPSVYWYPGSGCDLTPLVLDQSQALLYPRLFRTGQRNSPDNLILWMNDYAKNFAKGPDQFAKEYCNNSRAYGFDLKHFDPHIEIHSIRRGHLVNRCGHLVWQFRREVPASEIPIYVFQASVETDGHKGNPPQKATYTVAFSPVESGFLFRNVFLPFAIQIRAVALVRLSDDNWDLLPGRPGQIDYYRDYPELLQQSKSVVGDVETFFIDRNRDEIANRGYRPTGWQIESWGDDGGTKMWSNSEEEAV